MIHDAIAVVDFGGQYAHLIATKIRRLQVLAEIRQPEDPTDVFARYKGIVLSGSPSLSSFGEDSAYNKQIYELDTPMLGLCFGHQEIAKHYGGRVIHGGREWGAADMRIVRPHPIFEGLGPVERVWMSHFDSVVEVGPGFEELGCTAMGEEGRVHRFAAIGSDVHRRYGFQFHAEVDDTVHGDRMLANFVFGLCGCRPSWTMERYLEEQIDRIRRQVGDRSVFLLASGGVDSTVAARVFAMAIGPERLRLLHVDNGLMRKDESRGVVAALESLGLGRSVHFVDASEAFLQALDGLVEPEEKRRAIGDTFIDTFEDEARRLGIESYLLGQGTIYPDTIETGGTRRADVIKTHHNRVPIVEQMIAEGNVVEPLSELYKVEVRELGERIGIPHEFVWRHPFPGPGLGVRLLCSTGIEDRDGFDRDRAARGGGRTPVRSAGRAVADPLGRRQGRPPVLRAPGDGERAGRLGSPARGGGHAVQGGAWRQPLRVEPGACSAGVVPAAGRDDDAGPARSAARGRRGRDRGPRAASRATIRSGNARPSSCRSKSTGAAANSSWSGPSGPSGE